MMVPGLCSLVYLRLAGQRYDDLWCIFLGLSESSFYIHKVVVSVGSFVFSIITHEPFDDLHQILIGELGRTTEMFLVYGLKV